jgi:CRP-like cAMP-binding protein
MSRTRTEPGRAGGSGRRTDSAAADQRAAERRRQRVELLGALPLFSRLGVADLAALDARARVRRLSRGEVLFRCGDPARGFFVVIDGVMKLSVQGQDGSEKVLEVIHPGESFGEAVMLLEQPFPVTATALRPVRLLAVPLESVEHLLLSDPRFARRMLAGLAVRLHTMVRDVESYTLRSSRERVVAYLVACAERAAPCGSRDTGGLFEAGRPHQADEPGRAPGRAEAPGARLIVLATSKQVTASRLNLTPETFSRVLRELSQQGLVEVDGRRILVPDLEALAGQGSTVPL